MKSVISLALVLLTISLSSQDVFAKTKQGKKVTQKATQTVKRSAPKKTVAKQEVSKQAKLGTSFRFTGSSLRGKYQTSMGTAATVENDKLLDDLLNGRTNFEDRRQQEVGRN